MLALTLEAELVGFVTRLFCIPTDVDAMDSVKELLPVDSTDEPYYYTFKIQCTSCRETHPNWVSISRFVGQIKHRGCGC